MEKTADAWAELMARLNYPVICPRRRLGSRGHIPYRAPRSRALSGIHLNMVTVPPDPSASDLTEIELSALAAGSSTKNQIPVIPNNKRRDPDPGYGLGFSQRTGRLDC